jgi:hypothetical protein
LAGVERPTEMVATGMEERVTEAYRATEAVAEEEGR